MPTFCAAIGELDLQRPDSGSNLNALAHAGLKTLRGSGSQLERASAVEKVLPNHLSSPVNPALHRFPSQLQSDSDFAD